MCDECPSIVPRSFTLYDLIRDLFVASAITCFLLAMHRIATGSLAMARIKAFQKLGDAYTPEEREVLIHRIKANSLHM
ncbi:MAG: hypothetical protein HY876_04775 [Coriobacteriales bacterium]|nr:hypothetical protein [Coriobacteriales bacterium]